MEIQGRHLIVALLAVLTCLPAATSGTALGQDANSVDIRTAVPPARPGRVAAHVTVDKNRVRVGEWVRVNLTSPAGFNRPRFSVSFGDGQEDVTSDTQINHKYDKVGHYDVYAWVVSEPIAPPRSVPRVSLSVAPNPAVVGQPVTFNAQITESYPGIKYRFVFGDKDQTAWQDQLQTTHAYALAATYQAYVDIGAEENGSIKPLRGSAREPIRVNAQQPVSVDLTADPATVEVGRRVTFDAHAVSRDPNLRYRFVFGDGSPSTDWLSSSQATHEYASPNTYMAYVQIGSSANRFASPIISSARQPIRVIGAQRLSVDLIVDPTTVKTEIPVTFTAQVDSKDTKIRYRFFYGDRSASDWQVVPKSRHKYSVADTYFAYVEAELPNNNQGIKVGGTSKAKQVIVTSSGTPTPTPTPTPTLTPVSSPASSTGVKLSSSPGVSPKSSSEPFLGSTPTDQGSFGRNWWKYLLIALLIFFLGYRIYRLLFATRPTFRPLRDGGSSEVDEGTKPLAIDSQILLRPDIADGQFRVSTGEPDFVRSVRRENG